MSNHQETIAAYGRAWQEPDADERLALLTTVFGDSGRYTDPTAEIIGAKSLNRHIGAIQADNPGARIDITSSPTVHHDVAHFTWHMVLPDGSVGVTGHDFVLFDAAGRIRHLAGFFGDPKPL